MLTGITKPSWTAHALSDTLLPIYKTRNRSRTRMSQHACCHAANSTRYSAALLSKAFGIRWLEPECLIASPLSLAIYGDPAADLDSLKESIREQGILVPSSRGCKCRAGDLGYPVGTSALGLCSRVGLDPSPLRSPRDPV